VLSQHAGRFEGSIGLAQLAVLAFELFEPVFARSGRTLSRTSGEEWFDFLLRSFVWYGRVAGQFCKKQGFFYGPLPIWQYALSVHQNALVHLHGPAAFQLGQHHVQPGFAVEPLAKAFMQVAQVRHLLCPGVEIST
jgi:hypothetical protein